MSIQKREHQRVGLIYYPRVTAFDGKEHRLLGHLVDITVKGVKIISEKPIEPDVHFQLKIDVSLELGGSRNFCIDIEARSVWCRKDINDDYWDTGLQFMNMNKDNIVLIERFISEFRFNMVEHPEY